MSHPLMFDDDDPALGRLREIVAGLPQVVERVSHGRPHFRSGARGKGFAVYGGGVKVRSGEHESHEQAVLFKADPAEVGALDTDPRFWVPAYYGPAGWRGLDLDLRHTDWQEVTELLDASYRLVATRRLVAELDRGEARGGSPRDHRIRRPDR